MPTTQRRSVSGDALEWLTPKRRRFVGEYVVDFNAAAACIRAGYAPKSAAQQGARLLRIVNVQEAIARRSRELTAAAGVEAERVVGELARLGFSDIRSVLDWDEDGFRVRLPDEFSDDATAIIKSIEDIETITEHENGSRTVRRRRKITLHSKERPLEQLAKYTGVIPVAGGTPPTDADRPKIVFHFDGGPDAAARGDRRPGDDIETGRVVRNPHAPRPRSAGA